MKLVLALALVLATTAYAQTTGDEWFAAAASHLQKGEDKAAIEAYEKAWELGASGRMVAGYNLACLYARSGKADAAFAWLDKVKGMGFRREQIEADTDLASLKPDPRWATFLGELDRITHPCRAARHHELDFWIGDWTVKNAAGTTVGSSHIESILDGCVVLENWTGRLGETGKSFNLYDAANDRWQQTWVSDKGTLTEYHGRLEGGAMLYATVSPGGRLGFTPLPDGRVRQLAERQNADGTWSVGYDFYYAKR